MFKKKNKDASEITEVEVTFKNPKNLAEFILAIQRKDKIVTSYFDCEKFKVDFPHFMVSIIRKMKMMSKKHSTQPFNFQQQQKFGNQQWQPAQNFQVPQFFGQNPQMLVQLQKTQPAQIQKTQPIVFASISDVLKNKEAFLSLADNEKIPTMKKLLLGKLVNFVSLIDVKDQKLVDKVCDVFLDKEIIEQADLVEALGNEEEFENLLNQAILY